MSSHRKKWGTAKKESGKTDQRRKLNDKGGNHTSLESKPAVRSVQI
jgi:hypothetical protein